MRMIFRSIMRFMRYLRKKYTNSFPAIIILFILWNIFSTRSSISVKPFSVAARFSPPGGCASGAYEQLSCYLPKLPACSAAKHKEQALDINRARRKSVQLIFNSGLGGAPYICFAAEQLPTLNQELPARVDTASQRRLY